MTPLVLARFIYPRSRGDALRSLGANALHLGVRKSPASRSTDVFVRALGPKATQIPGDTPEGLLIVHRGTCVRLTELVGAL